MDNWIIVAILFAALVIETIAVVRRMGTLNYFESIFLVVVWFIVSLLVDLVITTMLTGRDVYTTLYFWLTYLVILLAVFLFHKKLHIEARKERSA